MSPKTAIVTGAASGIGLEIADRLVEMGIEVHGIDIKPVGSKAIIQHLCDVGNAREVGSTIAEIVGAEYSAPQATDAEKAQLGEEEAEKYSPRIDYLINAAGIITRGRYPFHLTSIEDWNRVLNVNLNGTFYVSKYVLPWMCPKGCVLNFSTEQVKVPNMKSAPYTVSKAGIEMLTQIMAVSLIKDNIRVNTIALGSVRTNLIRDLVGSDEQLARRMEQADALMPLGIIEPGDVWELARYLLFEADKITGQTILMDSGITIVRN